MFFTAFNFYLNNHAFFILLNLYPDNSWIIEPLSNQILLYHN